MPPCLALSIKGYIWLLSPLKLRSKNEMNSIWNERSRVINISWDNLFRSRPSINWYKLKATFRDMLDREHVLPLIVVQICSQTVGRRAFLDRKSREIVCSACCTGDVCNQYGCGQTRTLKP